MMAPGGTTGRANPPASGGPRERAWGIAFAALVLADLLWIAPRLLVADLDLDYPFVDGDSWDWIANGLALAGHPVPSSGRPPLVPLVLAGLERLGAMRLYPLLAQLLVHGTALGFYRVAARRHGPGAAFATGAALLWNHSYQGLSLDLMADVPASCLLFAAAAAFLAAGERPAAYAAAGLLAALAALTQQAALLLPVAAAVAVLAHRRAHLRSPWLWAGALLFAAPQLGWEVWKRLAFEGSDALVRHWGLLRLHDGSGFALWALASLLGLPGLVLLVAGLGLAWSRGLRRRPVGAAARSRVVADPAEQLFLATAMTALLVFFAFAYDFQAKRFFVHGWWLAGLLVAGALAALRRPALRRTAAAVLLAFSLLPLPAPGRDPSWIALWPLPPLFAGAGLTPAARGSADLDLASATLVRPPAADVARSWNLRRVLEARPRTPSPRLDPALFAADRGALFLYAPGEQGARYRTITRLGNALRRPLKFVPASWLDPYRGLVAAAPVGRLAETTVFRADVRGLAGSWLLLATAGGPAEAWLAAAPPAPPTSPTSPIIEALDGPLRRRVARDRRAARAIAAWVADSDGYVALLPGAEDDLVRLYLPLFLETTELRLIEPAEEAATRAFLAGTAVHERRIGGMVVRKAEILGRPSAIVEPAE